MYLLQYFHCTLSNILFNVVDLDVIAYVGILHKCSMNFRQAHSLVLIPVVGCACLLLAVTWI